MSRIVLLVLPIFLLAPPPLIAQEDNDWDEDSDSNAEKKDEQKEEQKEEAKPEEPRPEPAPEGEALQEAPMLMGAQTIPSLDMGFRLSGGWPYADAAFHLGIVRHLELLVEGMTPVVQLANPWIFGGGLRVNIFGQGMRVRSAIKIRAFGVLYYDANFSYQGRPSGLMLWPSFIIDMHIKEGCFYGEIGTILYPYRTGTTTVGVLYTIPMHFGGEIVVTRNFHIFANVGFTPFTWFAPFFTGVEVGVIFVL